MQRVLILGATSAIAEATARLYAADGAALFLAARDVPHADAIADDLRVRGASCVHVRHFDANDLADHAALLDEAWAALEGVDIALLAYGSLPQQADCDASADVAVRELYNNAVSPIALSISLAQRLRPGSVLAAISSVAGDRGRASNHLYGSAKAALSTFLNGLGQRLRPAGIHVLVVKPGFVDTPMTREFSKGPLWATPARVARGIVYAIERRRPVAYLPWFWLPIMIVIKAIPEPLFRRMRL